jgi:phage repressor protein C with HTH and peptisase S24 domain
MADSQFKPTTVADAYCVRISGDSLRPRIKSGNFVVLSPNHPYEVADEVLIVTKDGNSMIKEYLHERDGVVVLQDVNGSGERLTIQKSDIAKIHCVCAITKDPVYPVEAEVAHA